FFQAEDGIRDFHVTGVQTCALPIYPEAIETTRRVLGDVITYFDDAYDALSDADALAICTEWNEFRRPDFERMHAQLRNPLVFDEIGRASCREGVWSAVRGGR